MTIHQFLGIVCFIVNLMFLSKEIQCDSKRLVMAHSANIVVLLGAILTLVLAFLLVLLRHKRQVSKVQNNKQQDLD